MLVPEEFLRHLVACVHGQESPEDLEEWFSGNSWNVHKQGDEALETAVFRLEEWFSAYFEERLSKAELLGHLDALAGKLSQREFAGRNK
jgi:hypothetical protein